MLMSCKKDEQSCQDGEFSPGSEEQTDCGGVCPPCQDENDDQPIEVMLANVQGEALSFSNRELVKLPDWVLNFQNDSINVSVNFGDGDSLGARPIEVTNSSATFRGVPHSVLVEGTVLFSEINNTEQRLSGFFECKFLSDQNSLDTLIIKNGGFENIPW